MPDVERLLRIINGEADPEGATQPAPDEEATRRPPLVTLSGRQMNLRERALAALRFRARRARSSVVRDLKNGRPPSFQQQCDYAKSRRPAPGSQSSLDDRSEVVFQALVGRPGVAAGNAISAISARRMRSGLAFTFAFLVTVISLCIAGLAAVAAWLAVIVAILAVLIFLALKYWPSRPAANPPESD